MVKELEEMAKEVGELEDGGMQVAIRRHKTSARISAQKARLLHLQAVGLPVEEKDRAGLAKSRKEIADQTEIADETELADALERMSIVAPAAAEP
jgi:hypothetical protein